MKHRLILLSVLLVGTIYAVACTTAIVSGKHTADGRPLLLKQRDTGSVENKIMSFADGKYDYVGLVNSQDTLGLEVWGGHNSAGFAIMNSASYNLNQAGEPGKDEREGIVMKLALQTCATLADFEKLLETLPKPMFLEANFGVMDAQGGVAYYETGDYAFTKFDANNAQIAPMGYIIRTNFSVSGKREQDKGLSRFRTASALFEEAAKSNSLSYTFILDKVSRSLKHGITGVDLDSNIPKSKKDETFVPFRDFVPRNSTASTIIVQGVKGKESPALTTMWTVLGTPLATVAIPVWINKQHYIPTVLTAEKDGKAPMCTWTLKLKKHLFPLPYGEGPDYLNLAALISADEEGIYQRMKPLEDRIISESNLYLERWRQSGIKANEMKELCDWVDRYTTELYLSMFPELSK